MYNILILTILFLVAYLIFKNIYILVLGGIAILIFYFFNYKEGAQVRKADLQKLLNKQAVIKGTITKKVKKK